MSKQQVKTGNGVQAAIQDTKLFSVLASFNAYEFNRLRRFIGSPYFNRNEQVIALFDAIEPVLRQEHDGPVARDAIWSQIWPDDPYNDLKFRKLCSSLLKQVERFLAQEAFEENTLHRADYLLQAINQKKLEPLYNSSIRTAQRLSDQYYFRPASYYYHQYAYEREIYSLSDLQIERSKVSNVEQIAQHLDTFYLAEKLRYYCDVISRSQIIAHEYDLLFMQEIIDHVRNGDYDDVVPINLYYQIYLTHDEPDQLEHYEKLKKLINAYVQQLPQLEAREVIDAALNYCIQKINRGHTSFIREIFEVYQEALSKELLYVNGHLDPWNFRNIIVSGLRLGEYDWVENFIHQYAQHIDVKYRDNAVSFNLANLYFYRKEYDKVIEQLREVEYEDPSYNLNSKTMLMFTYYETDEIDPLLSLLSSFAVYLRRNKQIPQSRKTHYLNLIKLMRALVRIPVSDKEALERLEVKINETEGVVNKNWLLEKINELKG
ncbi:MAG: hypothetical protein R3301_08515 [Saprospiraceae bacterium]|nr:hypothetical protein [Saprospiraceae bacterium]